VSCLVPLLLTVLPCGAQPLTIDGQALRATVDGKTGDLLTLTATHSGFSYLAERRSPLFQLQLAGPDGASTWKDSRSARAVAAHWAGERELALDFAEVAEGLDVAVRVRGVPYSSTVWFRLEIENRGQQVVEQVVFPVLRVKRPLGESPEDDRLFVPGGDGYVAGPEAMERQRWQRREYPGTASMQFAAYYDGLEGLAVTCRDTEGEPKLLGGSVGDGFVDVAVWFRRPLVRQRTYCSPWVSVGRAQGLWTGAAEDYRWWARKQWWAKPKTGERAVPKWLRDSPLVLSADFRPLGNGRMFVPLERATEFARTWQSALGADNILVEWRNWEHEGYYASPFYFPLYPSSEKVAEVLGDLHREGYHSQAMVAGLKWMISREAFHTPHYNVLAYDGRQAFEEQGKSVCVVGRDGQVLVDKAYFTWDGDHAYMCPATEFAREHFRNCARTLAQAGFDLFEFDQMNGGSCPPCYSQEHGHPPGTGTWTRKAIAELMQITREEGRRYNPDFAISMEDPGELYLPYLDTYISRANDVIGWPAVGPGSEVVPAFAYVYGDLIPSTNVDIQHTSRPDDMVLLRTAREFIFGAGLSTQLTPWQVLADYGEDNLFPTPDKMDRDQLTLLRNCVLTRDGPLRPYVAAGRMFLRPWLQVPRVTLAAQHQTGTQTEEATIATPAVLGSTWALPWRGAHVFVNPTTRPVEVREVFLFRPTRFYLNGEPTEPFGSPEFTIPPLSTMVAEQIQKEAPWPLGERFEVDERETE
jgi:hypothetical protein